MGCVLFQLEQGRVLHLPDPAIPSFPAVFQLEHSRICQSQALGALALDISVTPLGPMLDGQDRNGIVQNVLHIGQNYHLLLVGFGWFTLSALSA